jgi:hypothetical protein
MAFDAQALGLARGTPMTSQMLAWDAANLARPQFLWNESSSTLSFDPDGTGARSAITIATLNGVHGLASSDIWIV